MFRDLGLASISRRSARDLEVIARIPSMLGLCPATINQGGLS